MKTTYGQAVVVCYYDLAIHQLNGMANQLRFLKQPGAAEHLERAAAKLQEKRQGYLAHTQTQLITPNGAPAEKQ